MKYTLPLFVYFSITLSLWAQSEVELKAAVDSTQIKIGAQLNYTLQVKEDSIAQFLFP